MFTIQALETSKDRIQQPAASEAGIIPKLCSSMLFVGSSGSGKTTLLVRLMTSDWGFRGWFNEVYLISPTALGDDVQKQLEVPDENIISDLSEAPKFLEDLIADQKGEIQDNGADKAPQICVIFDDCISDKDLMKSPAFVQCFIAARHANLTIALCTQSYTRVPRVCRLQAMHLFYFRGGRSELELLSEEYNAPGLSKKEMYKMVDYATEGKYNFLYVNRQVDMEQRYRKNLDQIIVLESVKEK